MSHGAPAVGVTTMAVDPPERFRALARNVEDGGFDALWVCDSSLHARDLYPYLTLAAVETQRVRIGPNCTHPETRHPGVSLNAVATLHEVSGGRAAMVLGVGDRPVTELGCRTAAVDTVRESVRVFGRLLAGETVDASGPVKLRGARLAVPLPAALPLYLAASGPRMLELAGEVADGVLFFAGLHADCLGVARERIGAGARRAGRDPEAVETICTVAGSLRDDVRLARQECAPLAAWFPQTAPHYARLAGIPERVIAAIRAEYAGGHFDAARRAFAHVTDDLVDRFTLAGPAELWAERLGELVAQGFRRLNVFLLGGDRLAMVRDLAEKVLPRLGVR